MERLIAAAEDLMNRISTWPLTPDKPSSTDLNMTRLVIDIDDRGNWRCKATFSDPNGKPVVTLPASVARIDGFQVLEEEKESE